MLIAASIVCGCRSGCVSVFCDISKCENTAWKAPSDIATPVLLDLWILYIGGGY